MNIKFFRIYNEIVRHSKGIKRDTAHNIAVSLTNEILLEGIETTEEIAHSLFKLCENMEVL